MSTFKRSSDSNRYYWIVVNIIVDALNNAGELFYNGYEYVEYDKQIVHDMLKVAFLLNHPDTEFGKDGLPTSHNLNQRAYSDYLTECMAWGQTYLKIEIPTLAEIKEAKWKNKQNTQQ